MSASQDLIAAETAKLSLASKKASIAESTVSSVKKTNCHCHHLQLPKCCYNYPQMQGHFYPFASMPPCPYLVQPFWPCYCPVAWNFCYCQPKPCCPCPKTEQVPAKIEESGIKCDCCKVGNCECCQSGKECKKEETNSVKSDDKSEKEEEDEKEEEEDDEVEKEEDE